MRILPNKKLEVVLLLQETLQKILGLEKLKKINFIINF